MLLLARKAVQSVMIDVDIRVTVDCIGERKVRLKIEVPVEIRVVREELCSRRVSETESDRTVIQ